MKVSSAESCTLVECSTTSVAAHQQSQDQKSVNPHAPTFIIALQERWLPLQCSKAAWYRRKFANEVASHGRWMKAREGRFKGVTAGVVGEDYGAFTG